MNGGSFHPEDRRCTNHTGQAALKGACHVQLPSNFETSENGVQSATDIFQLFNHDRSLLIHDAAATVNAIRLFELIPEHPVINTALVIELLNTTKPTAQKAIDALVSAKILNETSVKSRDRLYSHRP